MGVIDKIIKEPNGSAHTNLSLMSDEIKSYLIKRLRTLKKFNKKKFYLSGKKNIEISGTPFKLYPEKANLN